VETNAGDLENSSTLHVHLAVAVNKDVGDCRVLQERLEWAEAEDFMQNFFADLLLFAGGKQRGLLLDNHQGRMLHFGADAIILDAGKRVQVDLVEQLAVQRELELLVFRPRRSPAQRLPQALFPPGFDSSHLLLASTGKVSTVF